MFYRKNFVLLKKDIPDVVILFIYNTTKHKYVNLL